MGHRHKSVIIVDAVLGLHLAHRLKLSCPAEKLTCIAIPQDDDLCMTHKGMCRLFIHIAIRHGPMLLTLADCCNLYLTELYLLTVSLLITLL